MKKHSLRLSALLLAGAALLWLPVQSASALEMRQWLKIDGTILEAEFIRQIGTDVELRDKQGRVQKLAKAQLSFGDLDYIAENAPPDKTIKTLGGAKPKLPIPAREVKVDTKVFKKEAGDFKINSRTYRVCETPHFKVMYMKPADPIAVGELAERLWVDTAFFHSTFIPKWTDRKMGIILVNDDEAYNDVGSWYADMLTGVAKQSNNGKLAQEAQDMRKTWPHTSSGNVNMPQAQADEQKMFSHLRVFRTYRTINMVDPSGKVVSTKKEQVKGVWVPFNTHVLAGDMLQIQSGGGGVSQDGKFALFTGHSYYKEILLTGKSETAKVHVDADTGQNVESAGGFQTDRSWASELKKMIKKGGQWTPNLDDLMKTPDDLARQKDIAFAYAFVNFLQSTPERLTAFNKLCQKVDVSKNVPDLDEIATIYGYESADALKKAWVAWMESPEFR
jgi:hypothetical protein